MKRIMIHMMKLTILAFTVMVVSSVVSPAHAQGDNNSLPAGVIGTGLKLMEIQRSPQDVVSTTHVNITLKFDSEGQAVGDSTCNGYGASYQTGPDQALTFHDLISTLRACVDTSLMDLESEYYNALQGVTSYSFDSTTMQLFYNNGNSVLKFGTASKIPGEIPGMPRTGGPAANDEAIVLAGLLLVFFGGLLASVQITRHKGKSARR